MMNPILLQMSKAFSQGMGPQGGMGQINTPSKLGGFAGKKPDG